MQKKQQQCTGDDHASSATQQVASDAVNDIPQNLSGDDSYCQSPSPKTASEPPDSCRREGRAEQQEQNSNRGAQRRELLVRRRVERPDAIERGATPKQSGGGKTCHDRTKEQENAYGRESWRLGHRLPHMLNISQRRGHLPIFGEASR